MNKVLILMVILFAPLAFADGVTELQEGDMRLSQADAKIMEVREICPINAGGIRCMALGSIVTVKITMNGCLDHFGGYFSKFEIIQNRGYLHFSSINIFNEASMITRCIQAPPKLLKSMYPLTGKSHS